MGYPEKNPLFDLNSNCKTITVSEPGYSYVFAFGNGKIIISDVEKINQFTWTTLTERISVDEMVEIFDQADIITLVNWSYLVHFHEIYEKFLENVISRLSKNARKIYIDIVDCAKRQPEEIKLALKLFGRYSEYAPTYLGLNKSEAMVMHSILCENPKKTTGGGDNFNSGFCAGLLAGLDIMSCLVSGMTTSYLYVKNAIALMIFKKLWKCTTTGDNLYDKNTVCLPR